MYIISIINTLSNQFNNFNVNVTLNNNLAITRNILIVYPKLLVRLKKCFSINFKF